MSGIVKSAREAGVNKVRCPHCNHQFSTEEIFRRFFQGIVDLVKKGQTVRIPKFGTFKPHKYKGRSHRTPVTPSGKVKFPDTNVMKFKQAAAVKRELNKRAQKVQDS